MAAFLYQLQVNRPHLDQVLYVLFGLSENPTTVRAVLSTGAHVFLEALGTPELSDALAELIRDRAAEGASTFWVSEDDIRDLIAYFFRSIYYAETTDRIGLDTARSMQRTLNDTLASVARLYQAKHLSGQPPASWLGQLRQCLTLLLTLTNALRSFLPSASFAEAWSDAHVLAVCLKSDPGSTLTLLKGSENLPLVVLFDGILGAVMQEDDVVCERALNDFGTGFSACACSHLWRNAAELATGKDVYKHMRFADAFLEAVEDACKTPPLRAAEQPLTLPPPRPLSPTAAPRANKRGAESPGETQEKKPRRLAATPSMLLFSK